MTYELELRNDQNNCYYTIRFKNIVVNLFMYVSVINIDNN